MVRGACHTSYEKTIFYGDKITNKCLNKYERAYFDLDPENPPCFCASVKWPKQDYWVTMSSDGTAYDPFNDVRPGGWI